MKLETATQKIRSFFDTYRRLPSYQEMCQLFGYASKKACFEVAKKLIAAGILAKDHKGRLSLVNIYPELPLLGTIRAGTPSAAEEQLLETMSINSYVVNKPHQSYLLKVTGDSMIDAGIHQGDLVVIERGRDPREGDIVVAMIDGAYTLKYFHKNDGKVRLVAANKNYPPLYPEESLTIWGIVVSVIRKYH